MRTLINRHDKLETTLLRGEIRAAANMGLAKVAVQWLNEHLRFVSSFVVADSFRLRNRQLLVAANRCQNFKTISTT